MQLRTFGRVGWPVSQVGYGMWGMGDLYDPDDAAVRTRLPGLGNPIGIFHLGCDQGAEVDFTTLDGGGHSWPGGDPRPEWIVGRTSQDIAATRVMWKFFRRFSLND